MQNKNTFVANNKTNWPLIAMSFIVMLGALVIGINYGLKRHQHGISVPKDLVVATVLPQPRPVIKFSLIDSKGKIFTNTDLQGHWTFVFFGFTNCGSICPTTMAALSKVYQDLASNQVTQPQYLLITIDPERDTAQKLNEYVTAFNKDFIGATGTQDQIDNLTKAFSVVYMKVSIPGSNPKGNDYNIDHSGAIMLLNPDGKLAAIFSMPHDPDKIASDFAKIANFYS